MEIFISWSGERSLILANTLQNWLPKVLPDVKPWVSSYNINAGELWTTAVGKQLASSNMGILCLTEENLQSPWLLFEAGALSKEVNEACVIPYCLGVSVEGPLAQFQAADTSEEGTRKLIESINGRGKNIPQRQLSKKFEKCWPDLKKMLSTFEPVHRFYDIQITHPKKDQPIHGTEYLVNGTYSRKPPEGELCLFVVEQDDRRRWWPMPKPADLTNNKWSAKATFVLETYTTNVVAALVAKSHIALVDYFRQLPSYLAKPDKDELEKNDKRENDNIFKNLVPAGIQECHRVRVQVKNQPATDR